jgi:hypothetical protein
VHHVPRTADRQFFSAYPLNRTMCQRKLSLRTYGRNYRWSAGRSRSVDTTIRIRRRLLGSTSPLHQVG